MNTHYSLKLRVLSALSILIFYGLNPAFGQKQNIKPTIEPAIFSANTEITITYDVTGSVLANLHNAWIWVWIPNKDIDAKYNINPAGDDPTLTENAKFSKSTSGDRTTFSITFIPLDFFGTDIGEEKQLGVLLKGNDWNDGQTTDYVVDLARENEFRVILTRPEFNPVFVDANGKISIEAISSENADYTLSINGHQVDSKTGGKEYSYSHRVTETGGKVDGSLTVINVRTDQDTTINIGYIIRTATIVLPKPEGILPGINYQEGDDTKATLCLLAPMKSSVFVLGEFNDFTISQAYRMYRDGEYFWLEINGLTPQKEYAFQYLVDEDVYVADPYADKILDPDDQYIPSGIYPDLQDYPKEALKSKWYFNRLAVLKTGQTGFAWQNDNYTRPKKAHLIIYELLIRDFFGDNDKSYDRLIDTLSYFKNLGINTIELMPIQEFNSNSSWGYNPTFMFAPDKAYGTKNKLKEFIDAAHKNGIAVVLDIVFNHQDIPNPYATMYFDFTVFRPTPDNPWFNVHATHPFSVFSDMNHESEYTKHFVDTTLHYWISEYHVDGFRFDLSKGFTQTQSGSDVGKWGQKDQSRIDILMRMADKVWSYAPDTWLILEHFADNSEERILADHGFMLWGNTHGAYKEAILGNHENDKSDLSWGYAPERGFEDFNLVTYMESHDEERQMYEALQYGNSHGDYSVKNKNTALDRIKAASAFFYTLPGPKMCWQFGELGYDISIEENGRTGEKPVLWEYYEDVERRRLHDLKAELIKFRTENDIFETGDFRWSPEGEVKRIEIGNDNTNMLIIGNFAVTSKIVAGNFHKPGIWYDFFTGDSFEISDTGIELHFEPGEFHIYTTKKIEGIKTDLVPWKSNFVIAASDDELRSKTAIFPNPVEDVLQVNGIPAGSYELKIVDIHGRVLRQRQIRIDNIFQLDIGRLPGGIYHLTILNHLHGFNYKVLKI
ncbi:MAG: alpha-amylase family glycosyl hydrolase [Cytophagales bacterium]|nr:alpha-amylase family glycosyl hydrolase [Cytophagales bacterium]